MSTIDLSPQIVSPRLYTTPFRDLVDRDAVMRVHNDYKRAFSDKQEDNKRNNRYTAIYEALNNPDDVVVETGPTEDRRLYSDTYLPLGAAITDTVVNELFNTIFSPTDYFEVKAENPLDVGLAQVITAHMRKRHKEMKFRKIVYRALQQACSYDYCVSMSRWHIEPGYIPERIVENGYDQVGPIAIPKRVVDIRDKWIPNAIDRADFEVLNYFNCYHDYQSTDDFEDSAFFIDVRWVHLDQLVAMMNDPFNRYRNIDEVLRDFEATNREKAIPEDQLDSPTTMIRRNRAKVIRYWTKDHVCEVVNNTLIRRQSLNGWPLHLWRINYRPNRFAGMGIIQRLERAQYDVNAIINSRRDHENLVLQPISVISADLVDRREGNVRLTPGKTLIDENGGDVTKKLYAYQPGNPPQGGVDEIAQQAEVMKMVSSVGDNQLAQYAGGRRTAQEAIRVAAGNLSKVNRVAGLIEETCIEPMLLDQFKLEQRYFRGEETFEYLGRHATEWVTVTPEVYKWGAQPKFVARGSSYAQERQSQTILFMQGLDRALAAPQYNNLQECFVEMWKLLHPLDYTRFVNDPNAPRYKIPPEVENLMFAHGEVVDVNPDDDDLEHIAKHQAAENSPDFKLWPKRRQDALVAHRMKHEQAAQGKASLVPPPSGEGPGAGQDESDLLRGQRTSQAPQGMAF